MNSTKMISIIKIIRVINNKFDVFALLYSIIYFLFMLSVAIAFYEKGYYDVYNVFFDDDPNTNIISMAYSVLGDNTRNAYSHLFLELVSIPIQILYKIGNFTSAEHLTLIVSPLMTSLSVFILYKTLCYNTNKINSLLLAVSFSLIFCNFIFGVMPSTYPQGLLSIILINYYFIKSSYEKESSLFIWLLLAILASSITITNVIIFAIYYFIYNISAKKNSLIHSLIYTAIISLASLFIVILLYLTYSYLFKGGSYGPEGRPEWIMDYLSLEPVSIIGKLKNLINTFYFAFVPSDIGFRDIDIDNMVGLSYIKGEIYNYVWVTIAIILTSLLIAIKSHRHVEVNLWLTSFIIVLYNFTLHSVFSYEQYLYVLHWILSIFMMMLPLTSRLHWSFISVCVLIQATMIYNFLSKVDSLILIN